MPTCYAAGCTNTSGRLPEGVILHNFPKTISMIRNWLENSGNNIPDQDALCSKILADKSRRYRMCSTHFTEDSYLPKSLIPTAVPCIHSKMSTKLFVEAGTQTVSELYNVTEKHDQWVQWPEYEFNFTGESWKIKLDHAYHQLDEPMDIDPIVTSDSEASPDQKHSTPMKSTSASYTTVTSPVAKESWDESVTESTANTSEFSTFATSFQTLDTDGTSSDENGRPVSESEQNVRERKFIVFESCIDKLLRLIRCEFILKDVPCGQPLSIPVKTTMGTMLKITAKCCDGHESLSWLSQTMVRDIAVGNLLVASSVLFSGSTFEQMSLFSGLLGLEFISKSTFFLYQKEYLFPAVDNAWMKEKSNTVEEMSSGPVRLAGDGQCDSPGHSAKYCIYTLFDMVTSKIVEFYVVEVTQCTSSVAMEKFGFIKCIEELQSLGIIIELIATDRHTSIAKVMREQFPTIQHQYDVWHVAKSIKKKVFVASKKKNCQDLAQWVQSISNHLWWSAKTCNQNVCLLSEKWCSIAHHVQNTHFWEGTQQYHECVHGPLATDDERRKKWLSPGDAAHEALKKIVFDKKLIKDLTGLTEFCHTGDLEVFHSMVLKYRPKRLHFHIDGMEARTKLAIMAHNQNVGREQAVVHTTSGHSEELGKLRYKLVCPKSRKEWLAKPIFEKMSHEHEFDMMIDVLNMRHNGAASTWQSRSMELPANIAKTQRPEKSVVIQKQISRFALQ